MGRTERNACDAFVIIVVAGVFRGRGLGGEEMAAILVKPNEDVQTSHMFIHHSCIPSPKLVLSYHQRSRRKQEQVRRQ